MTDELSRDVGQFTGCHAWRLAEHYHKALRKHRNYFCDTLESEVSDMDEDTTLRNCKNLLKLELEGGCVSAKTLVNCDIAEAMEATARLGACERTVDRWYNAAIAILRIIDVLEKRQHLGNKENKPKDRKQKDMKENKDKAWKRPACEKRKGDMCMAIGCCEVGDMYCECSPECQKASGDQCKGNRNFKKIKKGK